MRRSIHAGLLMALVLAPSVQAQTYGSAGQSWSGNWGFGTASDRSVAVQQAQIIKQAEEGSSPTSVVTYNTNYDNRYNYVEANSDSGTVTTDYQIGDDIGENTYAVGSLNTGSTTIEVNGDGNTVDAVNSAETQGCVDGSISSPGADYPYDVNLAGCR